MSNPKHVVKQQTKVIIKLDTLVDWEVEAYLDVHRDHKNSVDH